MSRNKRAQNLRTDQKHLDPAIRVTKAMPPAGVSLSFAYFRSETECLSTWSKADLKSLVGVIEKMRKMNAQQLKSSTLSSPHKYKPKAERFTRPKAIGKDHRMHEIRVDKSNTARMHGVIEGEVFYLVWLDRKHEVFSD